MTMMRLPIESHGRDLYATTKCTCPDPMFAGSSVAHLMKRTIRMVGYDDANFFENVNAAPRESECQCGRRFRYQWGPDGVDFEFLDGAAAPQDRSAADAEVRS